MALGPAGNVDFAVWAAPAAQKSIPESGWRSPLSHLLEWLLGPQGPPRPQKSTISCRPKNHALKTQVYGAVLKNRTKTRGCCPLLGGRRGPQGPRPGLRPVWPWFLTARTARSATEPRHGGRRAAPTCPSHKTNRSQGPRPGPPKTQSDVAVAKACTWLPVGGL
jgi:hypothetical protein